MKESSGQRQVEKYLADLKLPWTSFRYVKTCDFMKVMRFHVLLQSPSLQGRQAYRMCWYYDQWNGDPEFFPVSVEH